MIKNGNIKLLNEINQCVEYYVSRALWALQELHSVKHYQNNQSGKIINYSGFYFSSSGIEIIEKLYPIFSKEKKIKFERNANRKDYISNLGFHDSLIDQLNNEYNYYLPDCHDLAN